MIIDCHCHVYPDKIAEKASKSIGDFYSLPMAYKGSASEMIAARESAGITHSVIFSVATKPSQTESINSFIAGEIKAYPNLAGLGTVHPDSSDPEAEINSLISLGLKGVKMHHDFQGAPLDDPKCLRIYEICRDKGVLLLLHMGDPRSDFSHPKRLKRVFDSFGGLRVIGAHFGGWSFWKEAQEILSGYEGFMTDCSSSLAFLPKDEAVGIIRAYGAERVLFGTDYPMWDFGKELERFNALGLSRNESEKILYKNAHELFFE